ncbi:MAG: hypothetical protein ABJF10_02725 [Chthoniobacter sp.]|uniref:hypothetical protein n=1 Tax=Chthoniobacter sp. TaxID=2510640 RepID=UPI0032ABD1D6
MSSQARKTTKSKSPAPVLISVRRDGTKLGPYTVEQVQRMLDDGILLPADSAAYEGSDRWEPLYSVSGLRIARPATDSPTDRSLDVLMIQSQMKSKGVAVVLALFIPFLGLFYSAPVAALVCLFFGILPFVMLNNKAGTPEFALIVFSITYVVSIFRALAGVSRYNARLLARHSERGA